MPNLCLHTPKLQKQSALGRNYLLPIKQLAKQLEDTAKDMADKICSVKQQR